MDKNLAHKYLQLPAMARKSCKTPNLRRIYKNLREFTPLFEEFTKIYVNLQRKLLRPPALPPFVTSLEYPLLSRVPMGARNNLLHISETERELGQMETWTKLSKCTAVGHKCSSVSNQGNCAWDHLEQPMARARA